MIVAPLQQHPPLPAARELLRVADRRAPHVIPAVRQGRHAHPLGIPRLGEGEVQLVLGDARLAEFVHLVASRRRFPQRGRPPTLGDDGVEVRHDVALEQHVVDDVARAGGVGVSRAPARLVRREGGLPAQGPARDRLREQDGIHVGAVRAFRAGDAGGREVLDAAVGAEEGGVAAPHRVAVDDQDVVPDVVQAEVGAQVEDVELDELSAEETEEKA